MFLFLLRDRENNIFGDVDLQCYADAIFNLKLVIFVFDKKNYIEAQTLKP